jgi:predicted ATPase
MMTRIDRKILLNRINKNLYEVEILIDVNRSIFVEYIKKDVDFFLKTIKIYISSFHFLKEVKNENLLILLDEKLIKIIDSYHDEEYYNTRESVHFIEKYKDTFFPNLSDKEPTKKSTAPIFYIDSTFLDSVKIKNYFSLKEIEITNLKDKKEIYFLGENGDGKTILLQAILLALKKEYSGHVIEYIRDIQGLELSAKVENSHHYANNIDVKNLFAYGINRNKTADSNAKFDKYGYGGLFDTNDYRETTLLKDPFSALGKYYQGNKLEEAFIDKLNKTILMEDLKIFQGGDIDFNELSEGYKSTIIWLYDLVSRLIENQKDAQNLADLKGIVLIDEIDLYLHPKWKYDFVHSLREVFPNIQFIMVTHSMVTVLGASSDALFYKVYKEEGETKVSQPISSIKNLMANALSTSPLFDMDTARARYSDDNIDTSEDYLYHKIHRAIAQSVKGKPAIVEEDIVEMIEEELALFEKENGL